MALQITIRPAVPEDIETVADILGEAARWLEQAGVPLWREAELAPEKIAGEVAAGLFFLAEYAGEPAATVRFQLRDPIVWPDAADGDAAYIHRLAVRRRYARGQVSGALLRWASQRTNSLNRRYLRLDCEASRQRLRAVYEGFGFRHHSDRQVGSYLIARYEYDINKAPR